MKHYNCTVDDHWKFDANAFIFNSKKYLERRHKKEQYEKDMVKCIDYLNAYTILTKKKKSFIVEDLKDYFHLTNDEVYRLLNETPIKGGIFDLTKKREELDYHKVAKDDACGKAEVRAELVVNGAVICYAKNKIVNHLSNDKNNCCLINNDSCINTIHAEQHMILKLLMSANTNNQLFKEKDIKIKVNKVPCNHCFNFILFFAKKTNNNNLKLIVDDNSVYDLPKFIKNNGVVEAILVSECDDEN